MRDAPPFGHNILDAIGNTPMIELQRIVRSSGLSGRLLAKLENLNPGGSKKDRVAVELVREAKADGSLHAGQTVVELTSGNTGTGLALACLVYGHPFIAVMSRGNTPERAQMMRALGAEVVLVEQAAGACPGQVSGADLALVEQRTAELVGERDAFRADQFQRRAAVLAHERFTGPEIWAQTEGGADVFVDFVGTGSTFTGVMRYLRTQNPDIRGYVVEPAAAAVLAGGTPGSARHMIQGGGYGKTARGLPLFDVSLVTDYLAVTDEEAVHAARLLARDEGIFGGASSGANCAAAIRLLQGREKGAAVAFLICDNGLKYLSTKLFN